VNQNIGDSVIVTYGQSFDQHARSDADRLFMENFPHWWISVTTPIEVRDEMLWQGTLD
jgi:hypothetical protein